MANFLSKAFDLIKGVPTSKQEVQNFQAAQKATPIMQQKQSAVDWVLQNAKSKPSIPTYPTASIAPYVDPMSTVKTPADMVNYTSKLKKMQMDMAEIDKQNAFDNSMNAAKYNSLEKYPVNEEVYGKPKPFDLLKQVGDRLSGVGNEVKGIAGGLVSGGADILKTIPGLANMLLESDSYNGQDTDQAKVYRALANQSSDQRIKDYYTKMADQDNNAKKTFTSAYKGITDPIIERNRHAIDNVNTAQQAITNWSTDSGKTGVLGNTLGSGLGGMAPIVALTALTKNPTLAANIFGAQSAGSVYEESKNAGVDAGGSKVNALLAGILSKYTNSLGDIPLLGKFASHPIMETVGGATARGGVEQMLNQYSQNMLAQKTFDPQREAGAGVLDSGIMGGVLGAGLAGGTRVAGKQFGFSMPSVDEYRKNSYDNLISKGVPKELASVMSGKVGTDIMGGIKDRVNSPAYQEVLRPDKFTSGADVGKLFGAEKAYQEGKVGKAPNTGEDKLSPSIDLGVEARKYKSAEEFVKAQGQTVYRGGKKLDVSKINDEGLPVTFDNKVAEQFARSKNQFAESPAGQIIGYQKGQNIVENYQLSSTAKIATRSDIPDNVFNAYKQANPLTKPEVAEPIITKWAKENGYDAIDFRTLGKTSTKEAEIKVLNPDILKTKSQLTDIWKNAQSQIANDAPKIKVKSEPEVKSTPDEVMPWDQPTEVKPIIDNGYKNISDIYKSDSGYEKTVHDTIAEMESSQAGGRIFGEDGTVSGYSSSFPDWVPNDLRDSKLFTKVLNELDFNDPIYPKGANTREKALVDAIFDHIDGKLEVNTQHNRKSLEEKSAAYWNEKRSEAQQATRQKAIDARLEKVRAKVEEKRVVDAERAEVGKTIAKRVEEFFGATTGEDLSRPKEKGRMSVLETLKFPVTKAVETVWTKPIDFLEKQIQRGGEKMTMSGNKYLKATADAFGGLFKNAVISPERIASSTEMHGNMANAGRLSNEFQKSVYKVVGRNEQGLESLSRINDVLDPELAKTKIEYKDLTPKEQTLYKMFRTGFDLVHDMSFANGNISKELYEANKGKYSARMYKTYEIPSDVSEGMKAQNQHNMVLDIFKKREKVDNWKMEDSLRDPAYSLAKRLGQLEVNRSVSDHMRWLAKNGYTSDVEKSGYVKMPESKAYGDLAGKYVPHSVAEDFQGFFMMNQGLNALYDVMKAYGNSGVVRGVKKSLTVYNPLTHLANATSANLFSFNAGANPVTTNLAIAYFMTKKGKVELKQIQNHLTKAGVLGTNVNQTDLQQNMAKIQSLSETQAKKTLLSKLADAGKKIDSTLGKIYGGTDDIYKAATFKALLQKGLTVDQATARVNGAMQNYNKVGKFYDMWSKTPVIGDAFIKFQGNYAEMFKNAVKEKPLSVLAYYMTLKALSTGLSQLAGESEEDRKTREETGGSSLVPFLNIPLNWKIGGQDVNIARYIVPFSINQFEDEGDGATRSTFKKFLPGGSVLDLILSNVQGQDSSKDLPGIFADPILGKFAQLLLLDKDFRNKSIKDPSSSIYSKSTLSPEAMRGNQMNFLIRSFTPPVVNNFADMASTMQGGKDFYGNERNVPSSIARVLGIRTRDFGEKQYTEERVRKAENAQRKQDTIESTVKDLVRQEMAGEISTTEMIDRVKYQARDYTGDVNEYMRAYRDEQFKTHKKTGEKIQNFKDDTNRYDMLKQAVASGRKANKTKDEIYAKIKEIDDKVRYKKSQALTKTIFEDVYDEVAGL